MARSSGLGKPRAEAFPIVQIYVSFISALDFVCHPLSHLFVRHVAGWPLRPDALPMRIHLIFV